MAEILISIIIPAHNAASTLRRLIESLEFEESMMIEIIIVENGSQDNTLETAKQLAVQFPCVKVFQSEKGVSAARNEGLRQAKGKWIMFADADDWFLPGAVTTLLEHVDRTDFTLFSFKAGLNKKNVAKLCGELFEKERCMSARVRMLENPTLYMQVWSKLFSGDIIRKNRLQFDTRLALSEDSDFTLRYSKYCNSIFFSDKRIYHYDMNSASVMHTFNGKKAEQYLRAMLISAKTVDKEPAIIRNAFKKYILIHLNIVMVREVFSKANTQCFSQKKQVMKSILLKEPFAYTLRTIKLSDCKGWRMIPIIMLKLRCYTVAALMFQTKVFINAKREDKVRDIGHK